MVLLYLGMKGTWLKPSGDSRSGHCYGFRGSPAIISHPDLERMPCGSVSGRVGVSGLERV